ncbi:restriction endonuclease subunit S [Psychrobacter submarinus]|uniref:restriction endonuclease subunit S n=1 Tax=Psychrobacter submarinus TaxID=154108 RepID=UPI001919E6A3|nr:restriction endonuclease subunit S [Psychrobacter submarinus]
MIDKSNFKDILRYLDFEESSDIFIHRYANSAYLKVDFNKKELIYPEDEGLTVNERQTCNFSQNENFVVFECVHRLLAQGYKPEHIELEPKWQVGHGASGGRADVLIKDNQGDTLLIIECKTAGNEFSKAWNRTLQDGGQLFSYVKQTSTTQFICLYASNWVDEQVKPDYYLISLNDNESLIHELSELSDEPVLTYADSKLRNVEDIVATWKETYQSDYTTRGLFEPDIQPYFIGKKNYSLEDLDTISSSDIQGKYNEFATIMRQHNVSGRENAFDKLVNLFLCKIVDETNNPQDLKFHWKGISYDSPFDLQDRLQALYQQGMKKFLDEDVTYVRDDEVETAFRFYKNDPVETQKAIKAMFRRLKFFTNNDFAFIDVHNERLFGQNSAVLLKIVKMLQDIRLKTNEENQFLGDMFEGFLDQGVKQSEGQFFTPMPIVKFIMNALPLDSLIATSDDIPKVIDYACGAGHFLNEYATSIRPTIEDDPDKNLAEYYDSITGIEKEYRLSKVAKVSAFMYGQDDINIIYADALGSNDDIKNNSYSVLVANPPYSVKGFLDTLKPSERRQYELLKYIDEKSYTVNNSIETFFIERAKQLLKTGGVAAIIVPSSILTKGKAASTSTSKNVYVATREILLKYFDIIAIAEFGSGTFGKTGTNTVTLFLRRKTTDAPVEADHYAERVNRWFNPVQASVSNNDAVDTSEVFADSHFIDDYCAHLELDADDYKTLLAGNPSQALLDNEYFASYVKEFDKWSEIKNLKKHKSFKALSKDEQKAELRKRLINYLKAAEQDKVYYFVLASLNPQPVLIIKSPSKTKEMKAFLGYEWSSAKGNEGIKYLGSVKVEDVEAVDKDSGEVALEEEDKRVLSNLYNLDNIHTPLYNPKDKHDANKINHLINQNFQQEQFLIPEELEPFVTKARLVDMLDFTVVDFNKAISLIPRKKISIDTKWALVKIKDICEIGRGRVINHQYIDENQGSYPVYSSQTKDNGIMGYIDTFDFEGDYVTWTTDGIYAGTCFYRTGRFNCTNVCGTLKIYDEQIISYYYLSEALNKEAKKYVTQSANPKLMNNDMAEVKIPLPPINVQEQIISDCQEIDDEVEEAKENIKEIYQTIETAINKYYSQGYPIKKLNDFAIFNPSKSEISSKRDNLKVSFIEMSSVNEDGYIDYKEDRLLKDVKKGSYKYFAENDIIIAKITPCMENGKCAIATGLTNNIGFGSSEFHVIRVDDKVSSSNYVFAFLNRETIRLEAEKHMTGSSGHRRVPAGFYQNLEIPLPNIDEQIKLVNTINQLHNRIAQAQAIIDASVDKKHAIIESYL